MRGLNAGLMWEIGDHSYRENAGQDREADTRNFRLLIGKHT